MSVLESVLRWIEAPIAETTTYRCGNCGTTPTEESDSCTECGGEIERHESLANHDYWGPYY